MKFKPVASTSPKLVAHENIATSDALYSIKLSVVGYPDTGATALVVGVGSNARTQRATLTREQAQHLSDRLQSLIAML